jgi:phenylacetate-CoA ligase
MEGGRLDRLNRLLAEAWRGSPFYVEKWRAAGLRPQPLGSPGELSRFPFTTREELAADQRKSPPFGRNSAFFLDEQQMVHRTSGTTRDPLLWLDTAEGWRRLVERSRDLFLLARVRPGDRVHLVMSFGADRLGPCLLDEGARRLGCRLSREPSPAPGRLREGRLETEVLAGKPSALLELARAVEAGGESPRAWGVRKALCVGAPGGHVPAVRREIEERWGAEVFDRYGLTEAGPVAGECQAHPGGLHLAEEDLIAEVVQPHTGEEAADGETGELVLTVLGRPGSPLVRYRTGDGAVLLRRHRCPCRRRDPLLIGGVRRLAAAGCWFRGNRAGC